jgi:hypothetical protein
MVSKGRKRLHHCGTHLTTAELMKLREAEGLAKDSDWEPDSEYTRQALLARVEARPTALAILGELTLIRGVILQSLSHQIASEAVVADIVTKSNKGRFARAQSVISDAAQYIKDVEG